MFQGEKYPTLVLSLLLSSLSNMSVLASLIDCVAGFNEWDQDIIVRDDGNDIDISCAVGIKAVTPKSATDQPDHYPSGSVYRFGVEYEGKESLEKIQTILIKFCCGCTLIKPRAPKEPQGLRELTLFLVCNCSRVHIGAKDFEKGKLCQSNTKKETVKAQRHTGGPHGFALMCHTGTSSKKHTLKKSQNLNAEMKYSPNQPKK